MFTFGSRRHHFLVFVESGSDIPVKMDHFLRKRKPSKVDHLAIDPGPFTRSFLAECRWKKGRKRDERHYKTETEQRPLTPCFTRLQYATLEFFALRVHFDKKIFAPNIA